MSTDRYVGRVAVITGAPSGGSEATARALALARRLDRISRHGRTDS